MDKRFSVARVLVVSVLAAYFLLGILTTGGVAPPVSVLVLILVLWFSVYKLRHKGLEHREIITKMKADLEGTLEKIKERIAQEEDRRRAAAEHEEQARVERERRRAEGARIRASSSPKDPAVSKYAEMIESRVREAEGTRRETEG
jgi:Sec-independent protein translocase protein TatA